ncbi:PadR family transcriptional regulator [Trichormus variabilis ARAD]|nr:MULTISPECIES: PadR family transcriptional regulator [Nostocaceae]MBC1216854.1 PadR family transcriptional regulator [Trichormus variabilis ARAD]MBC1258872.1 PadR family transcriptional regulator [Trichormus variabilis V5]MBC1269576.1 PadR family transcriptional regulator [Trichormus variabilis FSR]MBC1305059.1 PadR family transcriptional regulator [Trichormus variabilis N2B]MBC1313892.1 PadR family transcriptional regulator [Trichormus variabilis PNB]
MSLAYIILGFLQKEDMTGYDLKTNCFDQCIAHLWPADQGQIYKTLDKLFEQGWINCHVEIQRDRPNRKVYSLTEMGKTEFVRWLQSPQPLPIVREPLLVQLFFAAQLSNEAIASLLQQQLAAHDEKISSCEAINFPPVEDELGMREQLIHRLMVELIVRREETYIDWLKSAIKMLEVEN